MQDWTNKIKVPLDIGRIPNKITISKEFLNLLPTICAKRHSKSKSNCYANIRTNPECHQKMSKDPRPACHQEMAEDPIPYYQQIQTYQP